MRCWDCKTVIILPEVIAGEQGVAGSIRANTIDPDKKTPQVVTQEVTCGRCGSRYMLTTAKKPGSAQVNTTVDPDEERLRGWR